MPTTKPEKKRKKPIDKPTHIDLFSGIGGFSLAAEKAGWKTIVFCEKEPYCQKVLGKHWPNVPLIEDVKEFKGDDYRGASLLTGGFPCQDFSYAGQRKGKAGDRYLWPEMFRVIKESRPSFVVAENVVGIINLALDTVLSDLEGEGYSAGTVVLPACGINAPHRRDRVWILAHAECERQEGNGEGYNSRCEEGVSKRDCKNVPNTNSTRAETRVSRQKPGQKGITEKSNNHSNRRYGGKGFDYWATESDVCRVVDGLRNRSHRLRGLGNAIVPALAYEIFKTIYETEFGHKTKHGEYE
tara:strand:+ start:10337 stop:11230 length:894 start_codon:yes stop_codon:yes gene_type:complete